VEHLSLWAMAQVDFSGILRDLGFNSAQRSAAIGSIVGRMARPASEHATYQWLCQHSALGELLDVDYSFGSNAWLYRISDRLLRHREAIESKLFERLQSLFHLECTVTLYDLTNTYMEGEAGENPKAKRGHSKEKRSDCPLVTLGLVLDGSGFIRRSDVFAGNASESLTLKQMLQELGATKGSLVVMDRGIATEANIEWLREHGYRYLVVSRKRQRDFDPTEATTITSASGDAIHLHKTLSEDNQEVLLHCYSEKRARKEEAINERFAKAFEQKLQALHEGLEKPRTTKKLDKIHERIGRLKQSSRGVHQHYHIEVTPDQSGTKAAAITWKRQPKPASNVTHPGVYCLRSSETDWSEEKLWRTYSMLTDLEAVFRSLKSELGMRPVFHHKQERTDGHLFITVLAYQFVQIIRHSLRAHGINDRWSSLRQIMEQQCRITTIFKR
ncbi:IS1634 family transposase, partial [Desulfurispira natronophila]|uniref:IS1634 family transposase n=1 Tax=Desulfurispira natronophila TaxID=682562 RepID=UPI0016208287